MNPRAARSWTGRLGTDRGTWRAEVPDRVTPAVWTVVALVLVALPSFNAWIIPITAARLAGDDGRTAWWWHQSALVAAHGALLALAIATARSAGWSAADLGFRRRLDSLGTTLAVVISTAVVAALILRQQPELRASLLEPQTRNEHFLSLLSFAWAAVGQEVLFRTFALGTLRARGMSTRSALILVTVSFAWYHGGTYFGAANLVANGLGGMGCGLIYLKTGSLFATAIPHLALIAVLLAIGAS